MYLLHCTQLEDKSQLDMHLQLAYTYLNVGRWQEARGMYDEVMPLLEVRRHSMDMN
jgi:hypothetical protein